jgi:hypothetical protein
MAYFQPDNRKQWFEALVRSTRIRAQGSVDERVRATLRDVSERYSQLAALAHDYCFCGREAACYKNDRGKPLALCHLHSVAWEAFAEQERKDA